VVRTGEPARTSFVLPISAGLRARHAMLVEWNYVLVVENGASR
jgi:hypothetical protein